METTPVTPIQSTSAQRGRSIARQALALVFRFQSLFGLIIVILLAIYFSPIRDGNRIFVSQRNLSNVSRDVAETGILATGMLFVILVGGIDLSVGSIAALGGALSAGLVVRSDLPLELSVMVALAVGFGLGLVNGALVVFGRLPPFAATLSMMGVARGLMLLYTSKKPISIANVDAYTFWGRGSITLPVLGDVPAPVLVALVIVGLAVLLLTQTRFGLHIYAIGGNEETARLAGVPVKRIKLLTYGISGLLAALAGMLLTARLYSAQPRIGVGLELEAIASSVLGGVSLFGGVGNIPGAVIGALLIGELGNGMNMLRVESYQQEMIKGLVLVAAVTVDMYTKRLERRG